MREVHDEELPAQNYREHNLDKHALAQHLQNEVRKDLGVAYRRQYDLKPGMDEIVFAFQTPECRVVILPQRVDDDAHLDDFNHANPEGRGNAEKLNQVIVLDGKYQQYNGGDRSSRNAVYLELEVGIQPKQKRDNLDPVNEFHLDDSQIAHPLLVAGLQLLVFKNQREFV